MSERQKQIQFLKALSRRDEFRECQVLRDKIRQAERDERSLRRMIFLVLILMMLSVSTLCYGAVLSPDFFHDQSQFLLKVSCALGLASVLCLVAFTGYWLWCRGLLNELYHQCRELIMTSLRARSGSE